MSEDLQAIKERIYQQEKIEDILELLDCSHIRLAGGRWEAMLPDSDTNRSVQIKNNPQLNTNLRTRKVSGDIFTLVSYCKLKTNNVKELYYDLPRAKKWVCEKLGYYDFLDGTYKPPKKHNSWLKNLKKKRKKHVDLDDIKENPVLDEEQIKKQYIMLPHKEWTDEGIKRSTQRHFEVGYDMVSNRIITLIRNANGELIGVKGRTLDPDYKKFGIPKYLYLHKFDKSLEWFNLHRALPHIEEMGYCLIFEGYKSVMKATQYGYPNSISVEGDKISDVQIAILKSLGINIEFVFCLDKDVDPTDVQKWAKMITMRKVYGVFDKSELLGGKDSPVDKGKEVFEELLNKKVLLSQ